MAHFINLDNGNNQLYINLDQVETISTGSKRNLIIVFQSGKMLEISPADAAALQQHIVAQHVQTGEAEVV